MLETPEPVDWAPHIPLRRRIARALKVPAFAGGTVFVAAVIVAIALVWARPHVPAAGDTGSADGQSAGSESVEPTPAEAADSEESAPVYVHIIGEVAAPGVVELQAGARVEAAIDAAGGATDAAELSGVNLARVVVDGEQIVVPDADGAAEAQASGAMTGSAGGADPTDAAAGGGVVNLNTADSTALQTLPRVGPALAERILDWRTANGQFASVDQLLDVSGIGEKTLEGFRDQVRI
ncbi:MAG: ComEA family DNA-binding protein [Leucobacter sp.]